MAGADIALAWVDDQSQIQLSVSCLCGCCGILNVAFRLYSGNYELCYVVLCYVFNATNFLALLLLRHECEANCSDLMHIQTHQTAEENTVMPPTIDVRLR